VHSTSRCGIESLRNSLEKVPSGETSRSSGSEWNSTEHCLTDEQVLSFTSGMLAPPEISRIDTHLNACPLCAHLVIAAARLPEETASTASVINGRCWTFPQGARLGERFVIGRPLGRGGMGDVYESYDRLAKRAVALKTARAEHCDEPDENRRLQSEFELARRVRHPNVYHVYEAGIQCGAGQYREELGFLVMELIEGECLAQRLRRDVLTTTQACMLTRELLRGVAAIHEAGVLHRDIKSHNVMLRRGQLVCPVIIDFGLAVDARHGAHGPARNRDRFSPLSFEGSPAYMAPEQFRDGVTAPATDVFACGVVLFEALTGKLPFCSLRPDRRGLWRDPREKPLRATTLTPISAALDAFIARCLELDPERRYASAEMAAKALDLAIH
jgi:eukaryotic-like serine/threonine-protein kinase